MGSQMIEFVNEGDMLTVGKLLKNERERQELTLEDISDRTKINVKYIKAIEEERKDQFPGDLYYELFTKSYAEALGLEYNRVRAGTFTSSESRKDSEAKGNHREDKSGRKESKEADAKTKPVGKEKKSVRETPPSTAPAKAAGDSIAKFANTSTDVSGETGDKEAGEEETKGTKPDIVKYLAVTAGVIICLFIVFIYISISSRGPDSPEDQQGEVTDSQVAEQAHQPTLEDQLAAIEDSVRNATRIPPGQDTVSFAQTQRRNEVAPEDSLTEGPVWMYPESLDVALVSTQESWARVVADGDTVFTSFFRPNEINRFKALMELDFTLGRWEYITGSIYGHPLKPMRGFHIQGNNAVRLRIAKDNWELFIDSTRARYEHD